LPNAFTVNDIEYNKYDITNSILGVGGKVHRVENKEGCTPLG